MTTIMVLVTGNRKKPDTRPRL
ncbi:uncharacterized protein G2W53_026481 [Senna tora]|uniref:Uncharacterized protein n=1 Tax=Senna tora TaxID=362788 RepID=A0A834TH35_9FABA|nr:uncharacterized protein G2W53_026481 [Senna tora]